MNLDAWMMKRVRMASPPPLRAWLREHELPAGQCILRAIDTARARNGVQWNTLSNEQLRELVRRSFTGAADAWQARVDAARSTFAGLSNTNFADWYLLRTLKRQPWMDGDPHGVLSSEAWAAEARARGYDNDGTALFTVAERINKDAVDAYLAALPPSFVQVQINRVDAAIDDAIQQAATMSPPLQRALTQSVEKERMSAGERQKWLAYFGDRDAEEQANQIIATVASHVAMYAGLDHAVEGTSADASRPASYLGPYVIDGETFAVQRGGPNSEREGVRRWRLLRLTETGTFGGEAAKTGTPNGASDAAGLRQLGVKAPVVFLEGWENEGGKIGGGPRASEIAAKPVERLVKRAADGSILPEDMLEGQRLGAYYMGPHGFPLPGTGLGETSRSAHKGTVGSAQFRRGEESKALEARAWVRDHAGELGHLFALALGLPERPTVAEVERVVQHAIHSAGLSGRGATGVPGIGIEIPNSQWWFDPRMGTKGVLEWEERTGPITSAIGTASTEQVLRRVTNDGRLPWRLLIHYPSGHVSVGSGGYIERDAFILSPAYLPPTATISGSVARKSVARDEKDTLIDTFREAGWAYKEGTENEYLTAPSDRVRLQIKQRAVRVQHRDMARDGAYQEGVSVGPVKKVVANANFARWAAEMINNDSKRAPYHEPIVSKRVAEEALKAAGTDFPYGTEVSAYRFGFTAGREGIAPVVPKSFAFTDRDKAAWTLGYEAGVAPAPAASGAPHGDVEILHDPALGTIARGDTRPVKDALKRFGFKWGGSLGYWFVPGSKGKSAPDVDLDAVRAGIGGAL